MSTFTSALSADRRCHHKQTLQWKFCIKTRHVCVVSPNYCWLLTISINLCVQAPCKSFHLQNTGSVALRSQNWLTGRTTLTGNAHHRHPIISPQYPQYSPIMKPSVRYISHLYPIHISKQLLLRMAINE